MDEVINAAIAELIDEDWRALYESRLLRQAALLQFAGRDEDARLAQATASALHPTSAAPPQEQPFIRALIRSSIEQGPIRALAAALESGRIGPFPAELFPEKF
jgi:hypothetical protein